MTNKLINETHTGPQSQRQPVVAQGDMGTGWMGWESGISRFENPNCLQTLSKTPSVEMHW